MNREEFEQTATPLRAHIVGMVMTMPDSVDTSLADDVAQETLMKLWAIRDKLDEYRNIESLAIVIARNCAIDHLRKMSSLTLGLDSVDDTTVATVSSPEENIIRAEVGNSLLATIASLPSLQQSLIRMRHIEGLEIAEIASITGSSPASIRTALSRARQNIKQLFMKQQ